MYFNILLNYNHTPLSVKVAYNWLSAKLALQCKNFSKNNNNKERKCSIIERKTGVDIN